MLPFKFLFGILDRDKYSFLKAVAQRCLGMGTGHKIMICAPGAPPYSGLIGQQMENRLMDREIFAVWGGVGRVLTSPHLVNPPAKQLARNINNMHIT